MPGIDGVDAPEDYTPELGVVPAPQQNAILIFRSVTGTSPGDFQLLWTIPDAGGPWSYNDPGPFAANQLYIYQAQRWSQAQAQFSPMSAIVFADGPQVTLQGPNRQGAIMADAPLTATGVQTKLGIGREGTYGTPVQAQKMVDRKSGTLDMEFKDPDHETLANRTMDTDSVRGPSEVMGTVKITPSPEGFTRFICAMLGDPTTVNTPAVAGSPAVASYNTHSWLDTFVQAAQTLTEVKGPSFIAYPGCKADGMTLNVDKEQNTPIEMDFDMRALNRLLYILESSLGTDVAPFDPLPAWSAVEASLSISGAVSLVSKTFAMNFKKGIKPRQVLNGNTGPVSHYVNKSTLTGTIGQYFSTEAEMRAYYGVLDAQAAPYGASRKIRTQPLALTLASEVNAGGYINSLQLLIPRASYKKVGQPVQGPDEIMQSTEWKAYHDLATGSGFKLVLVNGESLAQITSPGTNFTSVPANAVQSLTI